MSRYAQKDAEKLKTAFKVKRKEKSVVATAGIAETQGGLEIKILRLVLY
jgi:putative SOS response-associated peptidase YedK